MFFYEGQSCPVCGQHFSANDDIVACPQCGCPHHRSCWQQEGHCHFEADHGTSNQWAQQSAASNAAPKTASVRCPNCGGENPEFAEFCGHCGRELAHADWHTAPHEQQYTPPFRQPPFGQAPFQMPLRDPYGGVPRDAQIEGVSADRLAELIGPNSAYYLPRFFRMSHSKSKISWNWASFLLPYNWLLYRKNILAGSLAFVFYTIISIFSQLATAPLQNSLSAASQSAMVNAVAELINSRQGRLLLLALGICTLAELALRLFVGLFGNYLYLRSLLKKAKSYSSSPAPLSPVGSFRSAGSTSFALAIAPELLLMFFMYALLLFTPI